MTCPNDRSSRWSRQAPAIRHNVTATELRNSIYTHRSWTEAVNEVIDKPNANMRRGMG